MKSLPFLLAASVLASACESPATAPSPKDDEVTVVDECVDTEDPETKVECE